MSICLIDTSIFCNVIPVPGRDQRRDSVLDRLREHYEDRITLLLPMAAIIETGNHIARHPDGAARRQTALRFARVVRDAVEGRAPFTPTPFFEPLAILEWLDDFPDSAMRAVGFGDLSVLKEFDRQCALHPARHVFIWSLDDHLTGYDRPARL